MGEVIFSLSLLLRQESLKQICLKVAGKAVKLPAWAVLREWEFPVAVDARRPCQLFVYIETCSRQYECAWGRGSYSSLPMNHCHKDCNLTEENGEKPSNVIRDVMELYLGAKSTVRDINIYQTWKLNHNMAAQFDINFIFLKSFYTTRKKKFGRKTGLFNLIYYYFSIEHCHWKSFCSSAVI